MSDFRIMVWNCNGITYKFEELTAFINKHNINIILLGETRLSPNIKFKIPNFHIYRTDCPAKPRCPSTRSICTRELLPIGTDLPSNFTKRCKIITQSSQTKHWSTQLKNYRKHYPPPLPLLTLILTKTFYWASRIHLSKINGWRGSDNIYDIPTTKAVKQTSGTGMEKTNRSP